METSTNTAQRLNKVVSMKLEDMTRDQLIDEVKRGWARESDLEFRIEQAWSRYDQANTMTKSYIDEFANRGLIHIPKQDTEGTTDNDI